MKKFFAFVAAALVAFGFTACEGAGGGSNFFKITVSNITETSADLSVVPADTTAYYGVSVYPSTVVAKYTLDTVAAYFADDIAYYLENGATVELLIQYGYLLQGKLEYQLKDLPDDTEYTVVACKINLEGNTATLGDVTHKIFKTKAVQPKEEKNLGELPVTHFDDWRDYDGSFTVYADDSERPAVEVALTIFDTDFIGVYNRDSLDLEYSYVWTEDMGENPVLISKAQVEGKLAGADKASLSGWVLGANGIKYTFSCTYSTVAEAGAPRKAAAKAQKTVAAKSVNDLQPRTLKVIRK